MVDAWRQGMPIDRAELARVVVAALVLVLVACDGDGDPAERAGDDAAALPYTQVFTIQQPTDPGLQQLINACASGVDEHSCELMCAKAICGFVRPENLVIYACDLRRSGPIATITVTYNGPVACPIPPPFPDDGFPLR
jgi:hypothetical protein